PIEDERGPGRRTNVFVAGRAEPIVASRTEQSILEDMGATNEAFQIQALREAVGELLTAFHEFSTVLRRALQNAHHFDVEMWERFSYYGMRAFLILYMTAPVAAGGLGFDVPRASSVYGTYTGSVWVTPILGGLVADRMLGAYRSVLLGGIVIALGHFTLALRALPFFYTGLALI